MADLRARFIEDYAGGLLNIARQELSSTGEVLAQDGFVEGTTLFVEDGRGVKSGLRLGAALAECVDPSTETGILNVRFADRTYAKIRDLKLFSTAVASAQAALSESVSESITNLEGAFESLEGDFQLGQNKLSTFSTNTLEQLDGVGRKITDINTSVTAINQTLLTQGERLSLAEKAIEGKSLVTAENVINFQTPSISNDAFSLMEFTADRYYALLSVTTSTSSWVTFYISSQARDLDNRTSVTSGEGIIADVVTSTGSLIKKFAPAVVGYSDSSVIYAKVRNKSGISSKIGVEFRYITL